MGKNRLEAFSDGVLAIIITLMVFEIKPPLEPSWAAFQSKLPQFLSYILSFLYIGIYWNNHHHLLHACKRVSGLVLWANLHLLFWLSLLPFATAWMGQAHFSTLPSVIYGVVLLCSACAYWLLERSIIHAEGRSSTLGYLLTISRKENIAILFYVIAIVCTFFIPWVSQIIYVGIGLLWCIPDRRIERTFNQSTQPPKSKIELV